MAINSVFDAVRQLQMFFERMGHPPWRIDDHGGRWHLMDSTGKAMGVDFGSVKEKIPADAADFCASLNYVPVVRRVKIEHKDRDASDLCVITAAEVGEQHAAAMLTSIMYATGKLDESAVVEVSGELTPSILEYDNHGIIPMCVSGPMSYVPTIKLKPRKKYEH